MSKNPLDLNHVTPTTTEQTNRVMRALEPELRKLRGEYGQVTRRQWIYGLLSTGAAAALGVVVWTRREHAPVAEIAKTSSESALPTQQEPAVEKVYARLREQYGESAPIVADLELYEDFDTLQAWNGRKLGA
jgi:hypothetical protein